QNRLDAGQPAQDRGHGVLVRRPVEPYPGRPAEGPVVPHVAVLFRGQRQPDGPVTVGEGLVQVIDEVLGVHAVVGGGEERRSGRGRDGRADQFIQAPQVAGRPGGAGSPRVHREGGGGD